MILWPRRREARPLEPKRMATQAIGVTEVFHARPSDVEDMIRTRLGDESKNPEMNWQEEDSLWPQEFCADD